MNCCIRFLAVVTLVLAAIVATTYSAPIDSIHTGGGGGGSVPGKYFQIKEDLAANKESICTPLANMDANQLTLDTVVAIFEDSLIHLANLSDQIMLIKQYVDKKMIENVDNYGGQFVLEISNRRKNLIDEYKKADKSLFLKERKKQKVLEKYFHKACESKLGAIKAKKNMSDAVRKIFDKKNKSRSN